MKYAKLIIFTICLLVLLKFTISFLILAPFINHDVHHNSCTDRYEYINHDLNCDEDPSSTTNSLKEMVEEVIDKNIKLKKATRVSIFYRDLINRQWFGINENDVFSPASLLKLPVAIAYYKIAETDNDILNKQFTYNISNSQSLYIVQNIKPEKQFENGKSYTINELIENMLKYSDNGALEVLGTSIDQKYLNKVYLDLGITFPLSKSTYEDFVSVKTYGGIMRGLYNASYLNQTFSNKLLGVLAESTFESGIVAGLPDGVKVANKFGERKFFDVANSKTMSVELHDCGIVYGSHDEHYVLCVMTQGKDYADLEKVIAEISKTIYQNR